METIRFTPGQPEVVALKFDEGKLVRGKFGEQMFYSTVDDRGFYLDLDPARDVQTELSELGIRPGEPFQITKVKTTHGGSRYTVARVAAQMPRGTAPTVPPVTTSQQLNNEQVQNQVRARSPQPQFNGNIPQEPAPLFTPASAAMCAAMCAAVDAIVETQSYAARKGLGVTFSEESVRAIGLSIYISNTQRGGR